MGIWKMVTYDTGECHFYFPEGLTIGMYYNEVISVPGDRLCDGWKTLWETRIKDPMEFERLRLDLINGRIKYLLEEEIQAVFSHDTNHLQHLSTADKSLRILQDQVGIVKYGVLIIIYCKIIKLFRK